MKNEIIFKETIVCGCLEYGTIQNSIIANLSANLRSLKEGLSVSYCTSGDLLDSIPAYRETISSLGCQCIGQRNLALSFNEGHGSEHEDCCETFKKLVRKSEYLESDNLKKLSVLARQSRNCVK